MVSMPCVQSAKLPPMLVLETAVVEFVATLVRLQAVVEEVS